MPRYERRHNHIEGILLSLGVEYIVTLVYLAPAAEALQQRGARVRVESFLDLTEGKVQHTRDTVHIPLFANIKGKMIVYVGLLVRLSYTIDIGDVAYVVYELICIEGERSPLVISVEAFRNKTGIKVVKVCSSLHYS